MCFFLAEAASGAAANVARSRRREIERDSDIWRKR